MFFCVQWRGRRNYLRNEFTKHLADIRSGIDLAIQNALHQQRYMLTRELERVCLVSLYSIFSLFSWFFVVYSFLVVDLFLYPFRVFFLFSTLYLTHSHKFFFICSIFDLVYQHFSFTGFSLENGNFYSKNYGWLQSLPRTFQFILCSQSILSIIFLLVVVEISFLDQHSCLLLFSLVDLVITELILDVVA